MPERPIEQYAGLLRIRKRWAAIGSVVAAICALITLIAGFGLMWAQRDKPVTGITVLLVLVLCVYPLMGVVSQLVEVRRTTVLLELLDVLKREASARVSEGREDVGE